MGDEGGDEAADGVRKDGFRGEFTVAERVEHGGVGAQKAAPTHADGGENGDGVAVDPTVGNGFFTQIGIVHAAGNKDGDVHVCLDLFCILDVVSLGNIVG